MKVTEDGREAHGQEFKSGKAAAVQTDRNYQQNQNRRRKKGDTREDR
jgi:hypothetical protein